MKSLPKSVEIFLHKRKAALELVLPKRLNREKRVPTRTDLQKIMCILDQEESIYCQCMLALTCSLRQSEIAALTAEDICGNIVKIHGARVRSSGYKLDYKPTAKSSAGNRETIMPDFLAERINAIKTNQSEGWLFKTHPETVQKRFKKLLIKNGLPPYTMHSLRHAFAAFMHAEGVPDEYIMQAGGWSTSGVMQRVYRYAFEEDTITAKAKVNQSFSKMQHEIQHEFKKV